MKAENRVLIEMTGSATLCELQELIKCLKVHVEVGSENTFTINCNTLRIVNGIIGNADQNLKDLTTMSMGGFNSKKQFLQKMKQFRKGLAAFYLSEKNVVDGLVVTNENSLIRCAFYYPSKHFPGTTTL